MGIFTGVHAIMWMEGLEGIDQISFVKLRRQILRPDSVGNSEG